MAVKSLDSPLRLMISKRWISLIGMLLLATGALLLGTALLRSLTGQVVKKGDTVTIHYTLLVDGSTLYYSTDGHKPTQYTLGQGQLLPGLEDALIGMQVGEKATVSLLPAQAYGPYRSDLVMTVEKSELPEGTQPMVGQQLLTRTEIGSPLVMFITGASESMVTLDANHPLAGKILTFEIELVDIERNRATGSRQY
jgi:peptidylprolyl isomerase